MCLECKKPSSKDYYYTQTLIADNKEWRRCASCSNRLVGKTKWEARSQEDRTRTLQALHAGVIKFNAELTKEEREARSRHAGAANTSFSVQRQWETIKADPKRLAKLKIQRGETSRRVWQEATPEERSKRVAKAIGNRKVSKSGAAFIAELSKQIQPLKTEVPITGFVVDALHEPTASVILYHGDFWHCNPKTFTDPERLCTWLGRTVAQQWKRDQRMLAALRKDGYGSVVVWESDAQKDLSAEIQRVLTFIGRRAISR